MMKEILRNGVLNTEFQAPNIFQAYDRGLLTSDGLETLHQLSLAQSEGKKASNLSSSTIIEEGKAWENVNHSVVLLGWGVDAESNEKYWLLRNSYGKKWGQDGDFMVRRGKDDLGIESEQMAFEPELL